jgi:DNA polymerase/3'-5' exonuclease PolX
MKLEIARSLAVETCYKINPFCDRLNIAGSIRRQKQDVKDIEIICLPKTYEEKDLFGETSEVRRSEEFKITVMQFGKVLKGKPSGRYMQIELEAGINLDLFIPQEHDYYRQYAIRTGSSQYSNLIIATAWKKLGWCGTEDGLRKMSECDEIKLPDNKSKWICTADKPTLPPVWNTEQEFFEWIQVPFLNPVKRSM